MRLHFACVAVSRLVTRWALRKVGVDEWLAKAVMAVIDIGNGVSLEKVDKFCYLGDWMQMYEGAQTVVRTEGDSKAFNVR